MEDLFKYAKEIRDTQKAPNNSKFYSILKQLEVLENNIDLSEIKDCKIRFQDYIDFNKNYQENYEYFCKYYNSDNELLNFNIYYLKKELSDILEMIVIGDLTVEEVDYLYSESFYSDIDSVINNIKRSFSKEFDNPLSKNINKAMVRSIFILPNNLDEIKDLSINSRSGAGLISIKKSLAALETLICTSYNDKEFSRHIHKIKNGRGNDLRLTEDKILGERYSTGKQTKVGFCKLPVHPENLKKLEDKFKYPHLESIYFILGFGSFKDIGISEDDLYSKFISFAFENEGYIKKLVEKLSVPFTDKNYKEIVDIIKKSKDDFHDIYEIIPTQKEDETDYNI